MYKGQVREGNPGLAQPELCKPLIPTEGLGISPTKAWSTYRPSKPSFLACEPGHSSFQPGLWREVSLPQTAGRLVHEEDSQR